jgi:tryptophan-rich sensory protein
MKKLFVIVGCVALCLGVGYASSFATQSSINTWYPTLNKPFFNPPNWIFAPVWSLLFVMMGIAAGRIANLQKEQPVLVKKALIFFTIQLALNALWSILFFGLCNPMLAFFEIILLGLFIFETIKAFAVLDKISSYLLYPYLAWVSFAALLNVSIWQLNP